MEQLREEFKKLQAGVKSGKVVNPKPNTFDLRIAIDSGVVARNERDFNNVFKSWGNIGPQTRRANEGRKEASRIIENINRLMVGMGSGPWQKKYEGASTPEKAQGILSSKIESIKAYGLRFQICSRLKGVQGKRQKGRIPHRETRLSPCELGIDF